MGYAPTADRRARRRFNLAGPQLVDHIGIT
jgi:hypothetical protein